MVVNSSESMASMKPAVSATDQAQCVRSLSLWPCPPLSMSVSQWTSCMISFVMEAVNASSMCWMTSIVRDCVLKWIYRCQQTESSGRWVRSLRLGASRPPCMRHHLPPEAFQVYQSLNVALTNLETSHVLHLVLLACCEKRFRRVLTAWRVKGPGDQRASTCGTYRFAPHCHWPTSCFLRGTRWRLVGGRLAAQKKP